MSIARLLLAREQTLIQKGGEWDSTVLSLMDTVTRKNREIVAGRRRGRCTLWCDGTAQVGRSMEVTRPIARLLLARGADVTC